jgi:hypothetical protein
MEDQGYMAIRPNTKMRIDTFQYKGKADGTEKGVFFLMKGGFRAITGVIGRKNKKNYQIKTPVASIGIRGTDHEPMFIPVPGPGETAVGEPGAYDKVNVGEAYIENDAGTVTIGKNEVGFTPDAATMPDTLSEMPAFYRESPTPQNAQQEEIEPSGGESEQEAGEEQEEPEAKEQGQEEPNEEPAEPGQEKQDEQQGDSQQQASPSEETMDSYTQGENPPPEDAANDGQEPGPSGPSGPDGPDGPDDSNLGAGDQAPASGDGGMTDSIMGDALGPPDGMTIDQPITSADGSIDLMDPSTVDVPPYRIVGFATWDPRSPLPPHSLVNGMPNHPPEVILDGSGNITGFEGDLPVIGANPEDIDHVHLDINADYTVTDTGSIPLDSGGKVIWGRWHSSLGTPQNIATHADSGAAVSPSFAPQDIHYFAGPEMTTPVVLPVTGTVSYTLVGNTTPTTGQGITGTLNSASLTAHFDQMTVDVGVNVSVPNIQLNASASGISINHVSAGFTLHEQGPSFGAGVMESTPLTVNCSGPGCGTIHDGTVAGGFLGQGGEAVAVGYSLNTTDNASIDTSVTGGLVFKT